MRNLIRLKPIFFTEFKDQIKNELAEVLKGEFGKREELESTVSVFHEHVHYYQNHLNEIKCKNKELETVWEKILC